MLSLVLTLGSRQGCWKADRMSQQCYALSVIDLSTSLFLL